MSFSIYVPDIAMSGEYMFYAYPIGKVIGEPEEQPNHPLACLVVTLTL